MESKQVTESVIHIDGEKVADSVRELFSALGLNPDGDLAATPQRIADFYSEFFVSLHESPPELTLYPVKDAAKETIAIREIPFYSFCSHHLLPFFGAISVAYVPARDEVLGFSGIVRIIRYFSQRPTLQEILASSIAQDMFRRLGGNSVYVEVRARQLCTEMRGVRTVGLETVSSALVGGNETWRNHAQRLLINPSSEKFVP